MKENSFKKPAELPGSMNKLVMGIGMVGLVLISPFVINNFIQDRILIGIATGLIVLILALNAWSIWKNKRYHPNLILFGLFPAVFLTLIISLLKQGIIGALWCYPAVVSFYIVLPERRAWFANTLLLITIMPFIWISFEGALMARIVVTLLIVSIFSAIFINVIDDQNTKLQMQAITDPLTGALNRTLLDDTLIQAVEQNNRSQLPMTLIMFDLDHFKEINDTMGHDTGDEVLKGFGVIIKNRCRRVDRLFRVGGEEFLLLLFNAGLEDGKNIAENIRKKLESSQIIPGYFISVSAGVATLKTGEDWKIWMKRSDENLYLAKTRGRNCVVG